MFGSLVSLISDLNVSEVNIFDLRQPTRFRFCSFQGFVLYVLSYMLIVSYDELFGEQCIPAAFADWKKIVSACGLAPDTVIYPFLYMIGAFIVINLFKRADWSSDAIFNNLSMMILMEGAATAVIYQLPYSTLAIQTHAACYFPLLSLSVLAILGAISLLGQRCTRPPNWTLRVGLRTSPGIFWLLAMYLLLSAAFFIEPVIMKSA